MQHTAKNGDIFETNGTLIKKTRYAIFLFHNGYKERNIKIVDETSIMLKDVLNIQKIKPKEINIPSDLKTA